MLGGDLGGLVALPPSPAVTDQWRSGGKPELPPLPSSKEEAAFFPTRLSTEVKCRTGLPPRPGINRHSLRPAKTEDLNKSQCLITIPQSPGYKRKIICHTKSQKNLNLNEKRQPTYANSKMTQILELSDKEVKAAVLKMLQQAIMNTLETNDKIESLSKETEDAKEYQTGILEL